MAEADDGLGVGQRGEDGGQAERGGGRENSKGPEDCRHCSISPFSLAMDCIDQGTRTGCPRG
jgi:hypothetical protein